jgi:hypothetical protein
VNTTHIKFGMRLNLKSFWPGIFWFTLSCFAFFLPGSSLPNDEWFGTISFDKMVHVVLFAVMVVLWSLPVFHRPLLISRVSSLLVLISCIFFLYSILVEFIQYFFVWGRSFDLYDILADGIGCAAGFLFVKGYQRFLQGAK